MNRIVLTLIALMPFGLLNAQTGTCEPDAFYADSTAGVYPRPYDPVLSPHGGISECAIIGQPYQFKFTIVISDTLTVAGSALALDSIVISAVQNLPVGLAYACNPTNCHFQKDTIGCAVIFGTPTAANMAGDYDLKIVGSAYISGFPFPLPLEFPNAAIAAGKYTLQLLASNATPCTVVATRETLADKVALSLRPNPTAGFVEVKAVSELTGKFILKVVDLPGRTVYQSPVDMRLGSNTFSFDGSNLSNGMYILTLENEQGNIARKLTIQH